MKNSLNKTYKGFTIIEVMIVLAIAGLIMVIVFYAIPQLQRNQRDNARQNVGTRVSAEMETYSSNNQGQYPTDAARLTAFTNNYFSALDKRNPKTGTDYTLAFAANVTDNPTENQILIYRDSNCNGETAALITGGSIGNTSARSYALRMALDRGSTFFCVDNG